MATRTRPVKTAASAGKATKPARTSKASAKGPPDDKPIVFFEDQKAWRVWLDAEHVTSPGVWLKIAKFKSGTASVTYMEALDVALCYGWIDGQKLPFDDVAWLQKFTPRRPKSPWSRINTRKAEALIAQKLMKPAGLREIERAKADGRWESAYDSHREITVPEDLQAALNANPKAKAFFATLTGTKRFGILYRVHTAKRPETRSKRIEDLVRMLERNETLQSTNRETAKKQTPPRKTKGA